MISFGTVDVVLFNADTMNYDGVFISSVPLVACVSSLGMRVALAEARTLALAHVCKYAGGRHVESALKRLRRILKLRNADAIAKQLDGLPDPHMAQQLIRAYEPGIVCADSLDEIMRSQAILQLAPRFVGEELNIARRFAAPIDCPIEDEEMSTKVMTDMYNAFFSWNKR